MGANVAVLLPDLDAFKNNVHLSNLVQLVYLRMRNIPKGFRIKPLSSILKHQSFLCMSRFFTVYSLKKNITCNISFMKT